MSMDPYVIAGPPIAIVTAIAAANALGIDIRSAGWGACGGVVAIMLTKDRIGWPLSVAMMITSIATAAALTPLTHDLLVGWGWATHSTRMDGAIALAFGVIASRAWPVVIKGVPAFIENGFRGLGSAWFGGKR